MVMSSKFPGRCKSCSGAIVVGESINYERGVGATHANVERCKASKAAASNAPVIDLLPIVSFLKAAQLKGLKAPKLRILTPSGLNEMRLGITKGGIAPGSISVAADPLGFLGCVRPDGKTTGALAGDVALQTYLVEVSKDPAAAAKKYAVLMCRCSFCGKELTDEGSVEVGYGPVCASNFGLPHSPKGTPELVAKAVA